MFKIFHQGLFAWYFLKPLARWYSFHLWRFGPSAIISDLENLQFAFLIPSMRPSHGRVVACDVSWYPWSTHLPWFPAPKSHRRKVICDTVIYNFYRLLQGNKRACRRLSLSQPSSKQWWKLHIQPCRTELLQLRTGTCATKRFAMVKRHQSSGVEASRERLDTRHRESMVQQKKLRFATI